VRVVLIGATILSVSTAAILLKRGHAVVIIDSDKARIDQLSEELDCAFVHGDGSNPAILREAGPERSDFLFCLTGHDETNILAALVGQSLGFPNVVPKIENAQLAPICRELGLTDTIIPDQGTARTLADMVAGQSISDLSTMIKNELRFFSFIAGEEDAGPIPELGLPARTRVVCVYRGDDFELPHDDTRVAPKDEVLLVTHQKNLAKLQERWSRKRSGGAEKRPTSSA
jgi:trk system potassium uptake protein TrkA